MRREEVRLVSYARFCVCDCQSAEHEAWHEGKGTGAMRRDEARAKDEYDRWCGWRRERETVGSRKARCQAAKKAIILRPNLHILYLLSPEPVYTMV